MSSVPPVARPAYIVAQGSSKLSAQCDCANLLQFLWILYIRLVPATHVRAFLSPIVPVNRWPSAWAGLPDLQVPPAYVDQVIEDRGRLGARVRDELVDLCTNHTVGPVILFYMDHACEEGLGDAGDERLTVADFRGYVDVAVLSGKHLLVIMDACTSTRFARQVWADLSAGRHAGYLATVAQHVCFLTSAEGLCYNSLTVVSKDPGLVYLFDSFAARTPAQLALGYRKHNSMFGRQLNWILAYRWPGGSGVRATLRQLVTAMNGDGDGRYGFRAQLVTPGADWADRAVEWLFPKGTFISTDAVPGWKGQAATVEDVIPSPAMGDLEDDIYRHFKNKGPDRRIREMCVEIGPGGHGRATVLGYGVVCKDSSDTGKIYEAADYQRDPAAEETGVAGEPSVSLSSVCWRFEELVTDNGWVRASTDLPDEAVQGVRRILAKKMNRPLDTPDWQYMALLTEYASIPDQRDAVFDVLENQWDSLTAPIEMDGPGERQPE